MSTVVGPMLVLYRPWAKAARPTAVPVAAVEAAMAKKSRRFSMELLLVRGPVEKPAAQQLHHAEGRRADGAQDQQHGEDLRDVHLAIGLDDQVAQPLRRADELADQSAGEREH